MINIKSKIIKIFLLIIAFIALSNFLVILIIPLPSSFILGMTEARTSGEDEDVIGKKTTVLIELTNGKLVFRYGYGAVINATGEADHTKSPDPVGHCKAFWYDTYNQKSIKLNLKQRWVLSKEIKEMMNNNTKVDDNKFYSEDKIWITCFIDYKPGSYQKTPYELDLYVAENEINANGRDMLSLVRTLIEMAMPFECSDNWERRFNALLNTGV